VIRASESTEILSQHFGTAFETQQMYDTNDNAKVLEVVRAHKDEADVMILVAHLDFAHYFPQHFAQKELDVELRSSEISHGKALIIDCEQKTLIYVE